MEGILKNGALHCRFLLMFALFDPPPAPFPAPSWSRAGPGRSSGMCISHVGAHARARARPRARTRARSPNSVFAVKGGEGVSVPPLSQTLSKENSVPTYQRYVGMLKRTPEGFLFKLYASNISNNETKSTGCNGSIG